MPFDPGLLDPTEYDTTTVMAVILALGALVLLVQSLTGLYGEVRTRQIMNRRLRFKEKAASTNELIVELRRQRALDEKGDFKLAVRRLNSLITRSGVTFRPVRWAMMSAALAIMIALGIGWRFEAWLVGAGVGVLLFLTAPLGVLKFLAGRRASQLARQLPDALQIVVRSLEAGHPVPSAVALVAREMPDPIGTEFGMAADEIAYGFSLTQAVERLALRAGNEDIELFAATVRLQERTGGNLCDLLKTNAATVRDRQTLRLKVKSASAEGRASAMILTAAPFVVMAGIHFIRPEFYGLVMHEKLFQYGLGGFFTWMVIGNIVMNRMINFRF
ncbi:MAG: pilus assembly protein TadB [Alphaproteobacteria bacterium]|jgi:tight adherence protein B|nr:pilus assembly protein TadB [Alphaproteobacteria bacterium]